MSFNLFRFRKSSGGSEAAGSGAGIIFLMMSLVFVPIAAAHIAVLWHESQADLGPRQLASFVGLLLGTF
jgi:hypothetical protein